MPSPDTFLGVFCATSSGKKDSGSKRRQHIQRKKKADSSPERPSLQDPASGVSALQVATAQLAARLAGHPAANFGIWDSARQRGHSEHAFSYRTKYFRDEKSRKEKRSEIPFCEQKQQLFFCMDSLKHFSMSRFLILRDLAK